MALVVFKCQNFFFLCLMYVLISIFCLDLRVVSVNRPFRIVLEVNVGKFFFWNANQFACICFHFLCVVDVDLFVLNCLFWVGGVFDVRFCCVNCEDLKLYVRNILEKKIVMCNSFFMGCVCKEVFV